MKAGFEKAKISMAGKCTFDYSTIIFLFHMGLLCGNISLVCILIVGPAIYIKLVIVRQNMFRKPKRKVVAISER